VILAKPEASKGIAYKLRGIYEKSHNIGKSIACKRSRGGKMYSFYEVP